MKPRPSNYDKAPSVVVPNAAGACVRGWPAIAQRLREAIGQTGQRKTVVVIDCYPGVSEEEVLEPLKALLKPQLTIRAWEALRTPGEIEGMCQPFSGGGDPVFGFLSPLTLPEFFKPETISELGKQVRSALDGRVLVIGTGARLIAQGDILIYADLARWEIQQRQRRCQTGNLGLANAAEAAAKKYKHAFFIDWRAADRWKKPLLREMNFLLDTHDPSVPKLAEGDAIRLGLAHAAQRPFRVVPLFDPGVWGGQWMKEVCDLDRAAVNFAWGFDCVPEENSLVLALGEERIELPALDLVMDQPRSLLGDPVHGRFGDEFPIRFDLLDTMGGGNLSFQVHPLTEYIQQKFGMHYTQDESYYLLDAGPDATVFLGLKEGIARAEFERDLRQAQSGGPAFPDEKYVNRWPAKKHDHFLIPAGTCHCSGQNSLVLEISATPYIFTFKMWDWGRLGLDGKPRPVHLDHGLANLQWDRTTGWVRDQLINRIAAVGQGPGWREERTGLHEREFIETRRHWFTEIVPHHTGGRASGSVQVLNLVQGEEAVVESPDRAFEALVVHYAETFIIPAAVGPYTVRPHGPAAHDAECATLKAYVRTGL